MSDISEVTYKCCWHCMPSSWCEEHPNSHLSPCNEPEDCKGKEVNLDA